MPFDPTTAKPVSESTGGFDPSTAKPVDNLPWDVPMTGAQMREAQGRASKADETLKAAEPEPGFVHLLASPFLAAARPGQAMLGDRPPLLPTEMLGAAAMGINAPAAGVMGSTVSKDLGAASEWAAKRGEPHPWTPEMVAKAAQDLGAPKVAKAERMIERRINQADPTTAQGAIDTLTQARASGKPMMLPDVLQGGVQGLAGRVARVPGEGSEIMKTALRGRNAGAVERLTGDINQAFGAEGAYDATQALMAARKAAAKAPYDEAYAHPPINPGEMEDTGEIGRLMGRPSARVGMANARKLAAEEGVDMNTLGIDLDEHGEPFFVRVPTWQTLDYIKRGIDSVVEENRSEGRLNNYGRLADQTRRDFVTRLRDLNPRYADALNAWSGPSESIGAIQIGKDALKMSPEQNAAALRDMSPNDREFARLGIGQALRDIANKRGPLAAEFDRVAGTQYGSTSTRQQLRPFFDTEDAYRRFVDSVTAETTMPRTANRILGGSQTAERFGEDSSPISIGDAAHTAIAGALGHKATLANRLVGHAQQLWDRRDPALNAEMARVLSDINISLGRDPRTNRVVLQRPGTPPGGATP